MKRLVQYLAFVCISFLIFMSQSAFDKNNQDASTVEKIYAQTDRPFYFPGETVWFKGFLVKENNTVSRMSDVVHAQLISPKGDVVKSLKLGVKDGSVYGDFVIPESWVGGIYKLKLFTNWMRNYGDDILFTKDVMIQKIVKPNLLLKLDFEKEGYGQNSLVRASFNAKDLKNVPLSNVLLNYTVSVKGERIITESISTNTDGDATPEFTLPAELKSADVVLNLRIPYNGSIESISRAVPVVLDNIDLQFLPESGMIVSGANNTIAFKALNEFGKPVDISGIIVTSQGDSITSFSSFHDGMGKLNLAAVHGKDYLAKINSPFESHRLIPLPEIHKKGTRFSVQVIDNQATIELHSTEKDIITLEISNADKKLFEKRVSPKKKVIKINTDDFPIGITKFSFKDDFGFILAERLVFVNPNKKLDITLELDKAVYQTREKVKLKIQTLDPNGNPLPSNISIAVADNKLLSFADDKQDHILSYLLLSSELNGKIYEPYFYFNPEEPKSNDAIDYLMLTHGWRTYIDAPKFDIDTASFLPEQGSIQTGSVVDQNDNPIEANLILMDRRGSKVLEFKTKTDGTFSFRYTHDNSLYLLAYREDGQKLKINKNRIVPFKTNMNMRRSASNGQNVKTYKHKITSPRLVVDGAIAVASVSMDEDLAELESVVVTGYSGRTRSSMLTSSLSTVRGEEIISVPLNSIEELLQGRAAGVNIATASGQAGQSSTIMIRGRASISGDIEPLFIIDGVPVNQNTFRTVNSSEVEHISVLKDAAATAIYGSRGSGGVIILTTKNGGRINNYNKKRLNNKLFYNYTIASFYNYNPSGVHKPRQYYVPKYIGEDLPDERTDFRQTIYWNPVVQTDENGCAELEFYNSDAITSFKVTAEGIGSNGMIGRQTKAYATKKLFNVDFKAPNYMVIEDQIKLPVTLTNESDSLINATMEIKLPDGLILSEDYKKNFSIEGNSTIATNISVVPTQKIKNGRIELQVSSQDYKDLVKKKVTVLSPYFPTRTSVSGATSNQFQFDIKNNVAGSIHADLKIYTDVVGDVMDGIESLIREPYGCFEQTSSATYPNIMVLKYLRATGKSNPDIEEKALNFIAKGYKRLKGFETKENGFEWFGRTPPHETLTAFGLMEFTEMQEVYPKVNQKMIERTKKWLLSRRDGSGGFYKSTKGYSSFTKSSESVANAYIVYALSSVRVKDKITLEYETAYKEAIQSTDTYRMALMALASHNRKNFGNRDLLLDKIRKTVNINGFTNLPVEHTVVNSYGNSKNIETIAFTLLALMLESENNKSLITQGIEDLLKLRKYNRFGSTQATAMALKALINYAELQSAIELEDNDIVEFIINGHTVTQKLYLDDTGKIEIDDISQYFRQGPQRIEVKFSNSNSTFPYCLTVNWDSYLPDSSIKNFVDLETSIKEPTYNVGDNVSMTIKVSNEKTYALGMVTSIIGVPSGTTPQPWQLKQLLEAEQIAFYEVFDNYVVFYWRSFEPSEVKRIRLDLKADIPGKYNAPASTAYLYYGDEFKVWKPGTEVQINN